MKFLVKEQGKFEEFPGLYFYLIYPKNEQKKVHKFFQKNLYILRTQFFTPHTIFIAFLCINILQISNFSIFPLHKLNSSLTKSFFYTGQFLVFLVCFPCEEFLVIKFLDSLFLTRNDDTYTLLIIFHNSTTLCWGFQSSVMKDCRHALNIRSFKS